MSIHSLEPSEVLVGTEALSLILTGENFPTDRAAPGVVWSAMGRSTILRTTVENASRLIATVPAELLTTPTLAWLVAWPGKPYTTNPLWSGTFVVRPPPPAGTSQFGPAGEMNVPRGGHQAVLLQDGRVLIVGGGPATAELYDPATGRFESTASTRAARLFASATLLASGKVLVAGGLGAPLPDGSLELLSTAEVYDPASGTFTQTGSMAVARLGHTATLLKDGRVLVTGGNDFPAIPSAEVFDPGTGTFTRVSDMSTGRTDHTATLLPSGKVLIAGGWNGHAPDALDDPPWDPLETELFDPATGRFSLAAPMSATRSGHQAVELGDGRVLLLGGIPPIENLHDGTPHPRYAEIFDPARNQLAPGPEGIGTVQSRYTATMLPDGGILLAGGAELFTPVDSAAVLDLGRGELVPIPGLSVPRVGHTATRLMDGRVLVTGGYGDQGSPLASAELYR